MTWRARGGALIRGGFVHLVSARMVGKLLGLLASIIMVRVLTKSEYGVLSYGLNIVDLFSLTLGLGLSVGILQFGSEASTDEERRGVLRFAIGRGTLYNLGLAAVIAATGLLVPLPVSGSGPLVVALALVVIPRFLHEAHLTYLRASLRNRAYSALHVVQGVSLIATLAVLGTLFGLSGVVAAQYAGAILAIAVAMGFQLRGDYALLRRASLPEARERRELLRYSVGVLLVNTLSALVFLVDIFFVGLIVRDEAAVASYKVATILPLRLLFLADSVVLFAYPYFVRYRSDRAWLSTNIRMIVLGLTGMSMVIAGVGIAFAPTIVRLLFGAGYDDAVPSLRVLFVGFVAASGVRAATGNLIAALRKVRTSFVIALASGLLNVVLDIWLVSVHGAVGAAIATAVTFFVASLLNVVYLSRYLRRPRS